MKEHFSDIKAFFLFQNHLDALYDVRYSKNCVCGTGVEYSGGARQKCLGERLVRALKYVQKCEFI